MISSPVKCFIIQLTLAFVVFFDNTLATSYEDWCENEINNIDIPLRDNARVLCKYFLESFLTANEEKQKSFWEDPETIKKCLGTSLQIAIEDLNNAKLIYIKASNNYDKECYEKVYNAAYNEVIKSYHSAEEEVRRAAIYADDYNDEHNEVYKAYEAVRNTAFNLAEEEVRKGAEETVRRAAIYAASQLNYLDRKVHKSEHLDAGDMAIDAGNIAYDIVYFNAKAAYDAARTVNTDDNAAFVVAVDHFGLVCIVKYSEFIKKGKSPSNILS